MEHQLQRSLWIAKPLEEVFDFFSDAANLERITPPELQFQIVTALPIPMHQGAVLEYRLALFGLGFGWTTEITEWEHGIAFKDVQRRGPYRRWEHLHRFATVGSGTGILDQVKYELPFFPVGELAHWLVRRQLERIFDFRANAVASIFDCETCRR